MTTVLVVDDEPTIREIVVGYLDREGYKTLEAADGNRARELLEGDTPDPRRPRRHASRHGWARALPLDSLAVPAAR